MHNFEHLQHFSIDKYREFLFSKYARQYARLQISYVTRFSTILENPSLLNNVPTSIKSNVLKSILNLAKYLGIYETFRKQLKQYGIKWQSSDTSFNAFLNIIDNNHDTLGEWYFKVKSVLPKNYQLWLKFTLITGARKWESLSGFRLIITIAKEGKLAQFYNDKLQILEWFKQKDKDGNIVYLRDTKNIYVSAVPRELINAISKSQAVYYTTLRKKLAKARVHKIRVKELRSYNLSYMRSHNIQSELCDLMQGRVPRSVMVRHYFKIKNLEKTVKTVLAVTATIESSLLS